MNLRLADKCHTTGPNGGWRGRKRESGVGCTVWVAKENADVGKHLGENDERVS